MAKQLGAVFSTIFRIETALPPQTHIINTTCTRFIFPSQLGFIPMVPLGVTSSPCTIWCSLQNSPIPPWCCMSVSQSVSQCTLGFHVRLGNNNINNNNGNNNSNNNLLLCVCVCTVPGWCSVQPQPREARAMEARESILYS